MPKLVLITLTGERKEAFSLCIKYLKRQTNKNFEWVVIDDGRAPISAEELMERCGDLKVTLITPEEKWSPGVNTQSRNILLALTFLEESKTKFDYLGFIEDDDWYHPEYVEQMLSKTKDYCLVGEAGVTYYLLQQKKWRDMGNSKHASLCQTFLCKEAIPYLIKAAKSGSKYIDIEFWRICKNQRLKTFLFPKSKYCVGLKELPGRGNIGTKENNTFFTYSKDPNFDKLQELIGTQDALSLIELRGEESSV